MEAYLKYFKQNTFQGISQKIIVVAIQEQGNMWITELSANNGEYIVAICHGS